MGMQAAPVCRQRVDLSLGELQAWLEGKDGDNVANPAYGDDVYSAIDEDAPGPVQPLYTAMDYGEVGEITGIGAVHEAYDTVEDGEELYEAPAIAGTRPSKMPPAARRQPSYDTVDSGGEQPSYDTVDAGGEDYANVRDNPYEQTPRGDAASTEAAAGKAALGSFEQEDYALPLLEQEDYANLLGEQKTYGKAFQTEDAYLVPVAGTDKSFLVPAAGAEETYETVAEFPPAVPRRPARRAGQEQGRQDRGSGYSSVALSPSLELDQNAGYSAPSSTLYSTYGDASLGPAPKTGIRTRSERQGSRYDGFDSAEAGHSDDTAPWMKLGMSRADADAFLLDKPEGVFVVRASSKANSFAISVATEVSRKKKNAAFHQVVQVKGMASASPTYRIQRSAAGPFASIAALVEHYSAHLAADDIPVLLSADHRAWGGDGAGAAIDEGDALYGSAFDRQNSEA